jgi:hypothetical protein
VAALPGQIQVAPAPRPGRGSARSTQTTGDPNITVGSYDPRIGYWDA